MFDLYKKRVKSTSTDSQFANDEITQSIKDEFHGFPNYYQIYKNGVSTTLYDVVINEGDKGEKLSGYKKLLSYPYDTPQFTKGDLIYWTYGGTSTMWLLVSDNKQYLYGVGGRIIQCENYLRWIHNGIVYEIPCVKDEGVGFNDPDFNKVISLPEGIIHIKCQANATTKLIKHNQRFLFDDSGQAWKVHTIENIGNSILKFSLGVDGIATDKDNVTLQIANYYDSYINDTIPSSGYVNIITPNITELKQGQSQVFEVWEYNNGAKTATKFNVEGSGALSPTYTLVGTSNVNTFTVTNVLYSPNTPLVITCTNLRNSSTETITINLKLW
jgi:hypothetical protein